MVPGTERKIVTPAAVENRSDSLMRNVENHGDGLMRNVENQGRENGHASRRRLLGRANPERGAAVLEMGECVARPRSTGDPWMLPTVVRANQGERRVCAQCYSAEITRSGR